MPLAVRPAGPQDAAVLAALAADAMRATYEGLLEPGTVEAVVAQTCTPEAFEALAARDAPARLLVAVEDGAVEGFLDFAQEPDGLELRRLYTRPGRTGRGTGAALLAALEETLPPGTTYRVVVLRGNARALAFWERSGCRPSGEVDGLEHFRAHRAVRFDGSAGPARLLVLHRTLPDRDR